MTGVSILAMEEITVKFSFNWAWFWITTIVIMVISIILAINLAKDCGYKTAIHFLVFCLIVSCMAGFAFGKIFENPIEYENIYKVTITDEVPMAEFMDKYEVIEQEGKIYTVRERDLK